MPTYVETDPTPSGAAETAPRAPGGPAASRWPRHLARAVTALLERRAVARLAGSDRRVQLIVPSPAPAIAASGAAPVPAVAGDVYFDTDDLALYKHDGTAFRRLFDAGTDGPGSGLDADLLDGREGSYYAPLSGAWSTYAPAWTASGTPPAVGNGTLQGRYRLDGKTCDAMLRLDCGSTTTYGTGIYFWSLPYPASGLNPCGAAVAIDMSTGTRYLGFTIYTAGKVYIVFSNTLNEAQPAYPMVWANGDSLMLQLRYETA